MRKIHCILLSALFVIGLASCGTQTAAPTATTTPTSVPTAQPIVVAFADPELETMVRGAMGKPEGDITVAEAEAVTNLNLSYEYQRYLSGATPITDIHGLEKFTNLESLDLSFHAISDISPLENLTKLTLLSLGGNPVSDISALNGLTNLKVLNLSNSTAQDYAPLGKLVKLQFLKLDNSTITDATPLASLTNLKKLFLANSSINDISLLANIYPNLEEKDFIIASTLQELGFTMDYGSHQANFNNGETSISINHTTWGPPPEESERNCIRLSMELANGYSLKIGYYPVFNAYVFFMVKNGEQLMNYVYDAANGQFMFEAGERERLEQVVREAMGDVETEDILLSLIPLYNNTIKEMVSMSADALYSLPFEPPSLRSLGFFPDEANAVYLYEYRGEKDVNMEVHRPEWGEKEYDVRFFTQISDEYRIVITYTVADKKFIAGIDDNYGGGANFEYFSNTQEHSEGWCSNNALSVEEYFINAFNDPEIEDIYIHSVELMENYIRNTFDMSIDELYALPAGE